MTWVAFVLGVLVLFGTAFDIVGTLVVPRGVTLAAVALGRSRRAVGHVRPVPPDPYVPTS